jgi:transcriptional regulator with XRE-family HTH domain
MRGNHLIREIRKRAGLTQAELAERLGTTQSAIARIERHGSPTLARLSEIAEACSLDIRVHIVPADAEDHDWSLVTGALARTPEQRFQSNRNAVRFAQSGRAAMAKETARRKRVGA